MDNTESTGSATTGPATFAEAFAGDASSASTPSETASADSASAGAIAPPADSASPEGLPQQGEPPRERWDAILANARTKATEETAAKYGWAKEMEWAQRLQPEQRGHLGELAQLIQETQGNPIALLQRLSTEIAQHPEYGPQLRSLAARQLGQGRGQQAQGPDLTPTPIQLEDGRVMQMYSAEQIAALQKQWLGEVEQKLAPKLQTLEQIQAERAAAQQKEQANAYATDQLSRMRALPHFKEHEKDIAERLSKMPTRFNEDASSNIRDAYIAVIVEKVLPTLSSSAQSQLLDKLQTKAAASTSVNPGAASSAAKSYDSFAKLPADMWR
jgi:hypothetical protein